MRITSAAPMRFLPDPPLAPKSLELHLPLTIRPAVDRDIPEIMALEQQSLAAAHWGEQEYRRLVRSAESLVLIAEDSSSAAGQVVPVTWGFLIARQIPPEWELENIVVSAYVHRKGIATQLLEALIAKARESKSGTVFLEVRESNAPARALYEKAGFRLRGTRKGYYTAPEEDAILYSLKAR